MSTVGQAGEIYVIGLGPGDALDLPATNLALMRGREVYLRTGRHPVVEHLKAEGVLLRPLDRFYEESDTFDEVYLKMADFLMEVAGKGDGPVLFAVPGNPLVGETVVRLLLEKASETGIRVLLWPAPGFLEAVCSRLRLDPARGLLVLDGFRADHLTKVPPGTGILVAQVYDRRMASEVKLALMEHFPDDHRIAVVRAAGVPALERVVWVPLYELDRLEEVDHLTTVYVPPTEEERAEGPELAAEGPSLYPLDSLVEVMERLLGPGGCPWDRQQTHASLKKYLIEEAYEVIDAVDEGNMYKLCEELGDLLLQVVFHAVLAQNRGDFTLQEVIEGIVEKLKRRHPHVFGEKKVKDALEVLKNWEEIKQEEATNGEKNVDDRSLMRGVPRYLPALQRAQKVQGKASLVGFDWPDAFSAAAKLDEEWREVKAAWEQGDEEAVRREMGDLLFAVVNVCRLLRVNAEEALRSAVDRFIGRFRFMEARAADRGIELGKLSLPELDVLWEEAKQAESDGR